MSLLSNYDYLALSPKAKLVLIHCWMAAADLWNPKKEVEPLLPSEPFLIRSAIVLKGKLYLHEIVEKGFLIRVPKDYNNLLNVDASKSVAEPYQSATPENREQRTESDLKTKEKESDETLKALLKEIHEKLPRKYFNPYEFVKKTNTLPVECHIDLMERLLKNDSFMNQEVESGRAYAQQIFNIEAGNVQARMNEEKAKRLKNER